MALMNDQKIDKRSKAYKNSLQDSNNSSENAPTEHSTTVNAPDSRDSIIQQMQEQMQKMNDKISSMERPKTDWEAASRINQDPKQFNYRLWDGKPICSAVSKRKNPSKQQLVDKNGESNHLLMLTFHDNTVLEVDVDDFGANFVHSPKMVAKVMTNPLNSKEVVGYEFTTKEYGTFTVSPGMIN